MFFRAAKNLGGFYLKVSGAGALTGGLVGAGISGVFVIPSFASGVAGSDAETMPGRFADGIKMVGIVSGSIIGTGMCIGGAPVTYPAFKLYEKVHKKFEHKEENTPSNTFKPRK